MGAGPRAIRPLGSAEPSALEARRTAGTTQRRTNWTQTVVSDSLLHADYISMAPGAKTPRRFHPDTREWWIVQDGQIRFNIEGQEPFIASKGYLVQVPYRTTYSLETIGDKPSLRLEVNIAGAQTMYPADETPAPIDGVNFVKVRIDGRGKYDQGNKPYIDFNAVVAGTEKHRRFIADDRAVANIIIGDPKKQRPLPTPTKAISTKNRPSSGSSCSARWSTRSDPCRSSLPTRATSSMRRNKPGIARASPAPNPPAAWR